MKRYYYSNSVSSFVNEDQDSICGKLARNDQSEAKKLQKNA